MGGAPPPDSPGEEKPGLKEKIDRIFHAFDVVEKHGGKNYLKATWELYPETAGKYPHNNNWETDRIKQQVTRWHKKVKRWISKLDPS